MFLFSCQRQSSNEKIVDSSSEAPGTADKMNQIPGKFKSSFRLTDQKKFSFTYSDIEKLKLVKIDSMQLVDLLQGDELLSHNRADVEHYFYSYQSAKPAYQAVTVLFNIEYNYSIYYLIYSSEGKLISKFEVAREGGDEVSTSEYGYFANDTTYVKTRVSRQVIENNGTKMDSVQRRIVFNSKGKLIYY